MINSDTISTIIAFWLLASVFGLFFLNAFLYDISDRRCVRLWHVPYFIWSFPMMLIMGILYAAMEFIAWTWHTLLDEVMTKELFRW